MTTHACTICTNGRVKHFRSGFPTQLVRCGLCRGTGRITAATWLRMFRAAPRPPMSRGQAIATACDFLGRSLNGRRKERGCEILENGVGGFVADLRAQGFGDVADRVKAAYLAERPFEAEKFDRFVDQVEAVRAG